MNSQEEGGGGGGGGGRALEWEACPNDRMFEWFWSEITYWSLAFVIGQEMIQFILELSLEDTIF